MRPKLEQAAAELAFDAFIESSTPKYEKAADCLIKYLCVLLSTISRAAPDRHDGPGLELHDGMRGQPGAESK
jgi:hypothetical protein